MIKMQWDFLYNRAIQAWGVIALVAMASVSAVQLGSGRLQLAGNSVGLFCVLYRLLEPNTLVSSVTLLFVYITSKRFRAGSKSLPTFS